MLLCLLIGGIQFVETEHCHAGPRHHRQNRCGVRHHGMLRIRHHRRWKRCRRICIVDREDRTCALEWAFSIGGTKFYDAEYNECVETLTGVGCHDPQQVYVFGEYGIQPNQVCENDTCLDEACPECFLRSRHDFPRLYHHCGERVFSGLPLIDQSTDLVDFRLDSISTGPPRYVKYVLSNGSQDHVFKTELFILQRSGPVGTAHGIAIELRDFPQNTPDGAITTVRLDSSHVRRCQGDYVYNLRYLGLIRRFEVVLVANTVD